MLSTLKNYLPKLEALECAGSETSMHSHSPLTLHLCVRYTCSSSTQCHKPTFLFLDATQVCSYRLSQLLSYFYPDSISGNNHLSSIPALEVVVNMLLHGFFPPLELQLTSCKMGKFMTHPKYGMMKVEYWSELSTTHTQPCSKVTHGTAVLLEMRLGEGVRIYLGR